MGWMRPAWLLLRWKRIVKGEEGKQENNAGESSHGASAGFSLQDEER